MARFHNSAVLLLVTALGAQAPTTVIQPDGRTAVDISRSAGLQAAGVGRFLGDGHRYMADFSADGMRFTPALGATAAETRFVGLKAVGVMRGGEHCVASLRASPTRSDMRVRYEHARGITERFDVGSYGVELSWRFDRQPQGSGDLVVQYRVASNLPAPSRNEQGGLSFVDGVGGVTVGSVTGIDAEGHRVAGQLHYRDGVLSMSLPAAFVADATYPLVLDPLVGTTFQVAGLNVDSEPDLAYDASNDLYLVAWLRTFSATLAVPRAQRVTSAGATTGNQIQFGSTGLCGRPRVANFPALDRFGVVYRESIGLADGIQFRAIDASTGIGTHQAVIASSTGANLYLDPDIGGTAAAPHPSSRAFVVCYEDNIHNQIRIREVFFNVSDQLVAPNPVAVFTDTGGVFNNSYTQPAISRQSRVGSRFLIVARRFSGTGPSRSIAVRSYSTSLGVEGTMSMDTTTSDDLTMPDVDGQDGAWTVAWERTAPGGTTAIRRRRVEYDGSAFAVGTIESFGGAPLLAVSAPTVAWSPARTRIGYRHDSGIGPQASLRLGAINTGDSAWCETEFSRTITTSETRIVATTEISGGKVGGEGGMAVFADNQFLIAQRLINHGSTGSFTNLGGQCGTGGSLFHLPPTPGIGAASVGSNISGLSPTAAITVFNLAASNAPVTCGPCVWEQFSVTSIELPLVGTASVSFPIPCVPGLIGSSYVIQWTTFDPSQSPCGLSPGVAVSDRVLMTIGN